MKGSNHIARSSLAAAMIAGLLLMSGATGQTQDAGNTVMLTIVLHQKQDKTVEEMQTKLDELDFEEDFPPPGARVESWNGVVGLGHVITLHLPAYRIPEVKRAVETRNWGDIRAEIYPTYDFQPMQRSGGDMAVAPSAPPASDPPRRPQRMLVAP